MGGMEGTWNGSLRTEIRESRSGLESVPHLAIPVCEAGLDVLFAGSVQGTTTSAYNCATPTYECWLASLRGDSLEVLHSIWESDLRGCFMDRSVYFSFSSLCLASGGAIAVWFHCTRCACLVTSFAMPDLLCAGRGGFCFTWILCLSKS